MTQSATIAELAKALSSAQGALNHARKEITNTFFNSKYADLASCIDAARPALAANGLSVVQITEFEETGVFLITTLMHSSGEWISGRYPLRPVKTDPQGMGSALTYARRYTFCAITGIAADDDDGNQASGAQQKKIEYCTPENFEAKSAAWKRLIDGGTKTADELIKTIQTRYLFTDAQKTTIKSWSKADANT